MDNRDHGTIRQYEPNMFGKLKESGGGSGAMLYEMMNAPFVTAQTILGNDNQMNLDRSGVTPKERLDAGMRTLMPAFGGLSTRGLPILGNTPPNLQVHHIIPNQIYRDFIGRFESIGWNQQSALNLKKLPTPFHGYHPKYTDVVRNRVENLISADNFSMESMLELQFEMRMWIRDAYKSPYLRMNDYFRTLLP